jgi:hypothetical protein
MGLLKASPAVRRRRRQRGMMWVLTTMTMVVLLIIAVLVRDISKTPTVAKPAALSVHERTTAAASRRPHVSRSTLASASRRPSASPSPSPSASASPTGSAQPGQVIDVSSGLSYQLLSSPWQSGCPGSLNTPMFSWSAGESAVAGSVPVGGTATDWYGNACSGLLPPGFQYAGVADLEPTATSLAYALDVAYYSDLVHYRTFEDSSAIQVSGHQAWEVTFVMTYPLAASEGLAWTSEAGAVVVVDRGAGLVPAVFYVSVPSNLGPTAVTVLVSSLGLSSPV